MNGTIVKVVIGAVCVVTVGVGMIAKKKFFKKSAEVKPVEA